MAPLNFSKLIPKKQLGFLIAGTAFLIFLIVDTGWSQVGAQLRSIGPTYLSVLIVSFFYYFLQTLAWQISLTGQSIPFWGLFKIKIASESLNALHPFSLMKGEALSSHLLRERHQLTSGADVIVTDRGLKLLALYIFMVTGFIVGPLNIPSLPMVLRYGLPLLAAVKAAIYLVLILTSREGWLTTILDKWSLFKPVSSPAFKGQFQEIDSRLRKLYQGKRGSFYQALLLHWLSYGLLAAEIYLIGSALMSSAWTASMALTIAALIPALSLIFYFLPGTMGVREGTLVGFIGLVVGASAAPLGIGLELVRRIRTLFWVVVGLILAGNPFKMFFK